MRPATHFRSIGFALTPGYALMSLTAAVEPLRAANQLARRDLYRSMFFSVEGGFMESTAGGGFDTRPLAEATSASAGLDLVFVVAGGNPMLHEDARLEQALRRLQARQVPLGGISGGAAILAKARLMQGRRFTVHWEHHDPLREYDPGLLIERALYVIDRDRYTCAGGVAALDMMCALIARDHGSSFARDVSDWFIHPRLRAAEEPQQNSIARRHELHHPMVASALDLMNSHIADPLDAAQIADLSDGSVRQLQRLFLDQLGTPMMAHYRNLRLAKADELVRQTIIPMHEVAMLTGFSSAAHFTRCFSQRYGHAPLARRRMSSPLWTSRASEV